MAAASVQSSSRNEDGIRLGSDTACLVSVASFQAFEELCKQLWRQPK